MCTVVNKYKEPYDVYIGRGSIWGNPYSHKSGTKAEYVVESVEQAIAEYKKHLWNEIKSGDKTVQQLKDLHGRRLGCFCKPKPCHGDVIVSAVEWAMTL